jgi:predicted molibdopterin-dependent oxidoreductase YjgC
VTSADQHGTPILFAGGFNTPSGRAQMVAVTQPALDETTASAQFGLILTTNRGPDAHGKLTENVPSVDLSRIVPTSDLVIHPDDAKRRDIVTGDRVRIASAYGALTVTALVSEKTQPGLVHLDFDVTALATNTSRTPSLDRPWRIGELKLCAVDVQPIEQARPEMVAAGGD